MKKALTIYVDDDVTLTNLCGAFIIKYPGTDRGNTSTVLQNFALDGRNALYLPKESDGSGNVSAYHED